MFTNCPRPYLTRICFALVVFLSLNLLPSTSNQVYAAGQRAASSSKPQSACPSSKEIDKWKSWKHLEKEDFFLQQVGAQSKIEFNKSSMSLSLGRDLTTGNAEIFNDVTELDPEHGLGQACWRPTQTSMLVMEVSLRFQQAQTPPGLFENVLLWNGGQTTAGSLATGIGVTRSMSSPYSAVISQDFVFGSPPTGLLRLVPMPGWLDATQWHQVRITVSHCEAAIEVIQGNQHMVVVRQQLLHPPTPLAVDFTIDNQQIPGVNAPVQVSDTISIADVSLGYQ